MRKPRFTESLNNAVAGITYVLKTERNMKIHVIIGFCILLMCLWLDLERTELAIIILVITIVIVAEIINTAVEAVVNLLSISEHPLSKIAKDVAKGEKKPKKSKKQNAFNNFEQRKYDKNLESLLLGSPPKDEG